MNFPQNSVKTHLKYYMKLQKILLKKHFSEELPRPKTSKMETFTTKVISFQPLTIVAN